MSDDGLSRPEGIWLCAEVERLNALLDAARREVGALRELLDRLKFSLSIADVQITARDAEIARLRALLKGALVPCGCGGPMDNCVGRCARCKGRGYAPVEVDHE